MATNKNQVAFRRLFIYWVGYVISKEMFILDRRK